MQVLCNKEKFSPGRNAIVSVTKAAIFGNIILGGGIGAIIDHTSGAAYEYPSLFQVVMNRLDLGGSKSEERQRSAVVSTAINVENKTAEEKLRELKRLFDAGLISPETFADQQREILKSN
jgi:hypothetical protein